MEESALIRGVSLRPEITVPEYSCAAGERVPYLDASAARNPDGALSVFLVKRSMAEAVELDCALSGFAATAEAVLYSSSKGETCCHPVRTEQVALPPLSWNVLRFYPANPSILTSDEICRLSLRRAYVKRDSNGGMANLTAHQYK